MIALIRGTVYRKTDVSLVVLVGDIGYEVRVIDPGVFEVGENVELQTYHIVKEDRQELYGFLDALDYEMFADLIERVPGVGARTALSILRSVPVLRLIEAVQQQDAGILTAASGVGKKNAERIIVELRPIVNRKYAKLLTVEGATSSESAQLFDEVQLALRSLGYSQREVAEALHELGPVRDQTAEELVSRALQQLSRK